MKMEEYAETTNELSARLQKVQAEYLAVYQQLWDHFLKGIEQCWKEQADAQTANLVQYQSLLADDKSDIK